MKNDFYCLNSLVMREVKIFLKDKASVFFSLLSPLIILVLYLLFLGDTQEDVVMSILEGTNVEEGLVKSFIDSWMLSGVISVATITVSFTAYNVVLTDKESGVLSDILSSPVKRWVIHLSYYIYNFLSTLFICTFLLAVSFVYLAFTGWHLTLTATVNIILCMVASVICSSLVTTAICGFLKTVNSHSACVGILSAVSGFMIGAYMPIGMLPQGVQYVVLFVPGTYSAGIFRNLFMGGVLDKIAEAAPYHAEAIKESYSIYLDFFGKKMEADGMVYALTISIVLFIAVNILIVKIRNMLSTKKRLNKSKKIN